MYRRKNRYTRFLIKSNKRIVFRMIRVVFFDNKMCLMWYKRTLKDLRVIRGTATVDCLMRYRVKCSWRAEHRLTSVQFCMKTLKRFCCYYR